MQGGLQATEAIERHGQPLCCRYLLLHFESLHAAVCEAGTFRDQTVRWALGVLADGQQEVVGAWLAAESDATAWQKVFEDLQVRGVEGIRFVMNNEHAEVWAPLHTTYPDVTVLPSIGHLLQQSLAQVAPRHRRFGCDVLGAIRDARSAQAGSAALTDLADSPWGETYLAVVGRWRDAVEQLGPLYASSPRVRHIVLSGDDAVQQLHRRLHLAVGRQRCFAGQTAATSFVVGALERAQRGLVSRGTVEKACVKHRAGYENRASGRSRVEALGL
jgi:putative transposase